MNLERFVAACLLACLAACATPAQRADRHAAQMGLQRMVESGAPYRHLLYFAPGTTGDERLHVYIEHDGTPWIGATEVAADPTPRNPLMLELMGLDSAPRVYLGRPCHFGLDGSPPCTPLAWTHQRYSQAAVDSMVAALENFLRGHPYRELSFFGYSGGGALALLLAERFPQTVAVLTLAGNLDIDAWTRLHGYSPLEGSINPAARPSLPRKIVQRHYAGGRDRNVPPHIARSFAASRPGALVVEVPEFDHVCCWREIWPEILAVVSREW